MPSRYLVLVDLRSIRWKKQMVKKILVIGAIAAALYAGFVNPGGFRQITAFPSKQADAAYSSSSDAIQAAFNEQRSGVQVQGEGVVLKLLADDNDGSRHQRFILKLPSGQTILVAHNIDLAPRVSGLKLGDSVAFNGVFEWNSKGGDVHWTHHDPSERRQTGWLRHSGQTYQ